MCGICGMVGQVERETLDRMMKALRHRGPDEDGVFFDRREGVALGHLRLSIIDVAGGRQPIFNEDESLCIVFNGEIYNFEELREGLVRRGHRFRTRSDTEVILHLFEEEGERTPELLNGMFAFAIWEQRKRELFLARDRLGIKPLFYRPTAGRFVFASELKGILADTSTPRVVDPVALDRYLTFMYVPAPLTMVRGVFKLPPGHTLTVRDGRPRLRKYWGLPPGEVSRPREGLRQAASALRGELRESVRRRLMSEVPLGAYLSGGLDSSLVVALMSQVSRSPDTFSVGFEESSFDESRYASRVAEEYHTSHHQLVCRQDVAGELERIFYHLDEPVADAAAIPTYLMAQATKPHVTVVLTGEGADELFAGYSHYKVLAWAMEAGRRWGIGGSSPPRGGSSRLSRAAALAQSMGRPSAAYLALKAVFTEDEKSSLLAPDMRRPRNAEPAESLVAEYLDADKGDMLQRLLRLDLAFWLPDDLLVKVDRMTMAHAVEARVPYLDHGFVESVMRLPSSWKLRAGVSKYLLRYAAEGLLPREIVRRPKTGFGVPVGEWAGRRLREMTLDLLGPASVRRVGWVEPDFVAELLRRQPFGMFHRRQFWTLFSLEMWRRTVLDADF